MSVRITVRDGRRTVSVELPSRAGKGWATAAFRVAWDKVKSSAKAAA